MACYVTSPSIPPLLRIHSQAHRSVIRQETITHHSHSLHHYLSFTLPCNKIIQFILLRIPHAPSRFVSSVSHVNVHILLLTPLKKVPFSISHSSQTTLLTHTRTFSIYAHARVKFTSNYQSDISPYRHLALQISSKPLQALHIYSPYKLILRYKVHSS